MAGVKPAPLQKTDVTTRVVGFFKELIANGKFKPGCKLPPERELAITFRVSRPSLRQALKVLEIMGVLSQRVGDGTYLSTNVSTILSEPLEFLVLLDGISHLELFEARMIVEPELAARAAERATAEDITILRRILTDMKRHVKDRERLIELDLMFHGAIFHAAGNRVCRQMFTMIQKALLTSILRLSQRADLETVYQDHKAIYSAIARRDPSEARASMNEHLAMARGLLLRDGRAERHRGLRVVPKRRARIPKAK